MQGRVHFYEGYTPQQVIFPMRVMARMGIRAVILTNAAGGINQDYKQGALVVLRDHINLQGVNPLIGPNEDRFGVRFPDMTQVYWKSYQQVALQEGKRLGINLSQGVYAAMSGPSYETPAEIHYLRTIGADLVGMSTVPEVIAAAHSNIRVLGISCVTNMAAGILDQPITTEEVIETGERVKADFMALLRGIIPRMNEDLRCARGRAHAGKHDERARFIDRRGASRARACPRAVFKFPRRRGRARELRPDFQRLQRGERHLRPDAVRRARRDLQGDFRRGARIRRRRRRRGYRYAHATLRGVPRSCGNSAATRK